MDPPVLEKRCRRRLAAHRAVNDDRGAEACRARERRQPGGCVLAEIEERTRRAGGQEEPADHAEGVFARQRGAGQLQVAPVASQQQRPSELLIVDERTAVAPHHRMELVPRGVFDVAVEHIPRDQGRLANPVEELVAALRVAGRATGC